MLKIMLFIDGTWLYSNRARLAISYDKDDFRLDYGRLPKVLAEQVESQLNTPDSHVVRTYLFGSYAQNCHEDDTDIVNKRRGFFDMLKEEYHYEVITFPIEFQGRRLRKVDRGPDDDFEPKEKCVDIALATEMLYYAAIPGAYDVAVAVIGDRDFKPVLQHVRRLGRQVAIASIKGSCAREFADPRDEAGVKDFDIVWLDDLLHLVELKYERHQLECQSPDHVGDRRVWTTYHPRKHQKFYCEDCQSQHKEETQQQYAVGDGGDFEPSRRGPHAAPGTELHGIVTKKVADRGFGFIQGNDGQDYFFHLSALDHSIIFETLIEGTSVDFVVKGVSESGQAPQAGNVRLRAVPSMEDVPDLDEMEDVE